MTVIVGIETGTGVILGGDSGSYGSRGSVTVTLHNSDPKVFEVGEFLVGVAGSARFSNVLQYCVQWPTVPKLPNDKDLMRFFVTMVVPRIRAACKANDLELKRNDEEDDDTGEALLGVQGCLFLLENDFHIERSNKIYNAIGIGAPVALGSLSFCSPNAIHENRLTNALEAAYEHCAYVRPPWTILEKRYQVKKPAGKPIPKTKKKK